MPQKNSRAAPIPSLSSTKNSIPVIDEDLLLLSSCLSPEIPCLFHHYMPECHTRCEKNAPQEKCVDPQQQKTKNTPLSELFPWTTTCQAAPKRSALHGVFTEKDPLLGVHAATAAAAVAVISPPVASEALVCKPLAKTYRVSSLFFDIYRICSDQRQD